MILDHLVGWPSGGFVGVDVFFVISGFLITGLLLREHEKYGRISFRDFYRRRARRILPVAMLVLIFTITISWLIFTGGRAAKVSEDGVWALVFGMNWHLAFIGTDYMQADGLVSPLQHFWSLAVEEQFYVVWPWVIVGILALTAGRSFSKIRARRLLGLIMLGIVGLSFGFAMWETATSPTFAYFSTFSRAWELGIGALAAISSGILLKIPNFLRPVLANLGLLGIAVSIFLITPSMPFPAPWAAFPVFCTALIIAAGSGGPQSFLKSLTNPVSRYLGDISYSLYLWHFPAIILVGALFPVTNPLSVAATLIGVCGLSALSYHFLEDPIRRSSWLMKKSQRHQLFEAGGSGQRLAIGGVIALGVMATIVAGVALSRYTTSPGVVAAAPVPSTTLAAAGQLTKPAASPWMSAIDASLAAVSWPTLTPSIDELGPSTKAPEWVKDHCLQAAGDPAETAVQNAGKCIYGDPSAKKTVVILGDSVAVSYVPGIRAAMEPQGYKILIYTMEQCPAISMTVKLSDGSPHTQCDAFRQGAISAIRQIHPDLVVMSNVQSTYDVQAWRTGAAKTFTSLGGVSKKIVALGAPPRGPNLQKCATQLNKPGDCVVSPPADYGDLEQATAQAAAEVQDTVKVDVVDTRFWYCSLANMCPSFIGGTPVYADGAHLTAGLSKALAPLIASSVSPQAKP
ncbi:acyltransferase family protein [Arthrobacter sp. FW306-04-A]|uniref:acyltransferase family protein n=1 Tax=Arthrobacter sp. FW306-04-A TaxID=2879619 RepID=UPI0037BF1584